MKPMILCATDFSPAAENAAKAALALAARFGCTLELVHVVGSFGKSFSDGVDWILEAAVEIAELRLTTLRAKLSARKTRVDSRVLIADQGQSFQSALITHATQAKPQMVVIGTHGKSESVVWPMGNFAETMAESFDVPVMVVHSSDALLKWLDHASELRLCAGVDLTRDAVPVLETLRAFRVAGDCEFSVCHVKPVVLPLAGILGGIDYAPDLLRARESDASLLRQLVRRHVGVWGRSHVECAGFGTDSQLIERAESDKADILVVGTHHRRHLARLIHGSFSRSVLRHSRINVLVVPVISHAPPVVQTRPPRRRTVHLTHSGR